MEIKPPVVDRVRKLIRLIRKDDAIAALVDNCNQVGEAYLFGGVLRDAIFGGNEIFGDIDIFVSGPLNEEFAVSLSRSSRRTNFGGLRLVVGKFDVDIWELPASQAFRIERGQSISVRRLLDSVCFSTDSIAVSLVNGKIIATKHFWNSLNSRRLAFVARPFSVEKLQVVRIARLAVKLGLEADCQIREYFLAGVEKYGLEEIVNAESKWRGRRVLDLGILRRVRTAFSNGSGMGESTYLPTAGDMFV